MKLISFQNIDKLWFFGLKESFILIIVLASLQEEYEIVTLKWSLRKATATARRVPEICILNNKFLHPHMRFFFFAVFVHPYRENLPAKGLCELVDVSFKMIMTQIGSY